MFPLYTILAVLIGYLYGSVNYAIIITKLTTGGDIRLQGNRNPGTANVARTVGRNWAVLVLFLDMSKSLLPLIMSRILLFTEVSFSHYTVLFAIGVAAICGHCFPVYTRFKGGRGIATSLGVYLFFIPGEFVLAALSGWVIVLMMKKRIQVRISQWVPIMFVALAPIYTSFLNRVPSLRVFDIKITGGHPSYIPACIWAVSVFILLINLAFMKDRFKEIGDSPS